MDEDSPRRMFGHRSSNWRQENDATSSDGQGGRFYRGRGSSFSSSRRGAFHNDRRREFSRTDKYGQRPGKSMGFMFLENLLNNDPEKMILTLIKERQGFTEMLEKDLSSDFVVLIIAILKKVSSSAFSDTKYNILQTSFNSKFISKLQTFIACLPVQDSFAKRSSKYFWKDPNEFFTNLLDIFEDLLNTVPTFAGKNLPGLITSLKVYIPVFEQVHETKVPEDVKARVVKLHGVIQIAKENEEEQPSEQNTKEPLDDFRRISVYPSAEEIVGGRGFLRENVVKGPYRNVEHYLDVQFRLLREDFVGHLRDGIANYRSSAPTNHLENVRVHKGVHFLGSETINEFYCQRLDFASNKKKLNFENSRRFMFGSLLCFTKDNFQTLLFGRVGQRKLEDLNKGQVIVAFDEKPTVDYRAMYLMVECGVYFEPYFHVLTVLKGMTQANFPMERYFIRVKSSVQAPEYLSSDSKFVIDRKTFCPLTEWPSGNFYNLNESQMVAFKAAITQEIVVIQGPPGTGKTYLGLKIAETLLDNDDKWFDYSPMLVICYTNHALDQFLEGLLPITRDIIRVGGQSKNTNLEKYNLRNKTERDDAVARKRREVHNCLEQIKHIAENLEQISFYNSVVSFDNFKELPGFDGSWMETGKDAIIEWLLEGATYGYQTRNNLHVMKAQEEFNRIGINEEFIDEEEVDYFDDVNGHIICNFDSIFDQISQMSRFKPKFLITLSTIRENLKHYEDELLHLTRVENPSLQQLIKEEELRIAMEGLRQTYEYLKRQLAYGRTLQDNVEGPADVDLRRPHDIDFDSRWRLYFYWLNLYKQRESDVLKMITEDFPTAYKEYEEMRQIEDVRAMKSALVVGMTTTSAARLRSSLQTLKNPIVIVEEAAEVLEAHIVTSITKHCKHLILIGDHKQLKPTTANFSMEKQYRLGISLFERMLINDIHCYTLNVQHRMRPEISCLIRPSIYDFLEDHPSVLHRPSIRGVDNCVFFVDHDQPEEACEGSSKTNPHEVNFLISLARHLVLNGYSPENITILAAYLGQFFEFVKVKKAHGNLLSGMKVAVLDNYQGEESDIILLSLVRNNDENKIGFLSIENRVCVALSRARNGMYIMGNMPQLCSNNELWRKIKTTLEKQKSLGKELPLRCQIHQDQVTLVKCDNDFFSVPEGGCSKKCDMDLTCGHKCTYLCHIRDRGHNNYRCQALCNKSLCKKDETHLCKKMCSETCGPCGYMVQRTLKCGHQVSIECHIDPEVYRCKVLVPTVLPCGHKANKPCHHDAETYRCPHICDVQVQPCGHACTLDCHVRNDPDHLQYKCEKPCTKFMKGCSVEEEDHRCKRKCFQECDPCTCIVRKKRTNCNHYYDVPCNSDVDDFPCEKPCSKIQKCSHPCKGKCCEPCKPCHIKVTKTIPLCGHEIKSKCCEIPDRRLCNKQCPLKLACGHPCTKKCNEPCTSVRCAVLVDCQGITAECGHLVTKVECHMTSSSVDPKSLIKYCTQPCGMQLKCGHICSGTCGECLQGRVHKRCSEKCGTLLVCNHECSFPCRQACRPCKRTCQYKCQHSICRKHCGEVCTPCKEPCTRKCRHQFCTKYCGDICTVPPCTEPCLKALKCGHPCIGFCGDPCPPLCMVCNKDELLEVFFGTETEDARYVFLNDCRHVIENSAMEHWLEVDENQISYKVCPKCKTAIRTTQRYRDYIKKAIKDIAQVKNKINGSPQEINEQRKQIEFALKKLRATSVKLLIFCPQIGVFLKSIQSRVQKNKRGRQPEINTAEAQALIAKLQLLEDMLNVTCTDKVDIDSPTELFFPQINLILYILQRDYITAQEIEDVGLEITRLSRIVEFNCIQKSPQFRHLSTNVEAVKTTIAAVEKHLFDCKRFTNGSNDVLKKLLSELNESMKTGLAISDRERREILQAMGFSKGHWYKCPNGHVYAIDRCGGAMEEANCYECGARIGGTQHRLLSSNAVATEMDGATHGAWSMRANMANYDLRIFQD